VKRSILTIVKEFISVKRKKCFSRKGIDPLPYVPTREGNESGSKHMGNIIIPYGYETPHSLLRRASILIAEICKKGARE
jgi:hypothetical protein